MFSEDDETAFEPLTDDERCLLGVFQKHGVIAVVIGGYAARVHGVMEDGWLRSVEDLDLVIEASNENLEKLQQALSALGVTAADEIVAGFRDRPKFKWRWRNGHDDHFVDVLSTLDAVGFATLWTDAVDVSHEDLKLRVMAKDHLIEAKRRAVSDPGRGPKSERDRKDLVALLDGEMEGGESNQQLPTCALRSSTRVMHEVFPLGSACSVATPPKSEGT
jgi:hypothetical protein